jgi:hypothetical protein
MDDAGEDLLKDADRVSGKVLVLAGEQVRLLAGEDQTAR